MFHTPKRTHTCFPDPAASRVAVLVIILTFVVIMAVLGYTPAVTLGAVTAAAAATINLRPAVNRPNWDARHCSGETR